MWKKGDRNIPYTLVSLNENSLSEEKSLLLKITQNTLLRKALKKLFFVFGLFQGNHFQCQGSIFF